MLSVGMSSNNVNSINNSEIFSQEFAGLQKLHMISLDLHGCISFVLHISSLVRSIQIKPNTLEGLLSIKASSLIMSLV